MYRAILTTVALGLALIGLTAIPESAQLMPKAAQAQGKTSRKKATIHRSPKRAPKRTRSTMRWAT